ncbi:MAG: DNA polymerase I [Planctomycetota bacterium]
MARTFLLDGTALAYQAHFAFSSRQGTLSTKDGHPTSASFGLALKLRALLKREDPDRIAIAFDGPREDLERTRIYPDYKGTRAKAPEELILQFDDLRELAEALGLTVIELEGHEADDVIGTMARACAAEGDEVFIVTADKDFMQLVDDDRIRLLDLAIRADQEPKVVGPAEVEARFGVPPEKIVDLLALMGDSSDNVPGVKGVGPKRAAALLQEHGDLEAVLAAAPAMKASALRDNLLACADLARLSRRLVEIRADLDLPLGPSDIHHAAPDRERLAALYGRLEFRNLLDELDKDLPRDGGEADVGAQDYVVVGSLAACEDLARSLREAGCFAFDTETTGLDVGTLDVVGMSFGLPGGRGWYVPLRGPDLVEGHDRAAWLAPFVPLLEDASVRKVGQNIKYDVHAMRREGVEVRGAWFDTMIASYCIDPERRHGLDALSIEYFSYRKIPTSDVIGEGRKAVTMAEVAVDKVGTYACEDADFTWRLHDAEAPELETRGVATLFRDLEMPLLPVLVAMEQRGVRLDLDRMARLSEEMGARIEELTASIHGRAGREFNINSPAQLGQVLFEELALHKELGIRPPARTKTGQYRTDASVLEGLAGHPIGRELLEYRRLVKLKGTYVDVLPTLVRAETGRVHTTYQQVAAATGRLSSDNPNLQNIPIRTEDGRRIRDCFVAGDDGMVLLSADYSQVELRILAHFSGDERLCAAFRSGADIHTQTAAFVHGVLPGLVTPEMRSHAKVVNYGLVYGMGVGRLANETGLPRKEAQEFIDRYFAAMPRVKAWLEAVVQVARERGEVRTLMGRVRLLPDLDASAPMIRAQAENKAVNTPIQGSAADIIKRAMIDLHRRLGEEGLAARLLLQVHDELVLECPEAEVDATRDLVRECMEGAADLAVPLTADIGVGRTWLEAHG